MGRFEHRGFTLVELLVVITIIVVLLAIMIPAMSRVIYTASLTECGSNLKNIATGVTAYAAENRMYYPHRPTAAAGTLKRANVIAGGGQDDRPYLVEHVPFKMLLDPLVESVDLDPQSTHAGTEVYANYALWHGMYYNPPLGSGRMLRMGSRFSFKDAGVNHTFSVLASDWDAFQTNTGEKVHASHGDADGVLRELVEQNVNNHVRSQWQSDVDWRRGVIDTNCAFADGSVERYEEVTYYETNAANPAMPLGTQRMVKVPVFTSASETENDWLHLPRHN